MTKVITIKCTKKQRATVKLIKQKYDLSNKQLFKLILKTMVELNNGYTGLVKKHVSDSSISFRTSDYILYKLLLTDFKKTNPEATTTNIIDEFIKKF